MSAWVRTLSGVDRRGREPGVGKRVLALVMALCTVMAAWGAAAEDVSPLTAARAALARKKAATGGPQGRLAGGVKAVPDAFPFQVSIILSQSPPDAEMDGHVCAATLVGQRWLLTAAHCLERGDERLGMQPPEIDAYLGSPDFRNGLRVPVAGITRHPGWNAYSLENDLALVKLDRDVPLGGAVQTVRLARALPPADSRALLVGWGVQEPQGDMSRVLRQAGLSVVDPAVCKADFSRWQDQTSENLSREVGRLMGWSADQARALRKVLDTGVQAMPEAVVCAGSPMGATLCAGDGGAPLLVPDTDGSPVQVGVGSWGLGCTADQPYSVFTSVPAYVSWIEQVMAGR